VDLHHSRDQWWRQSVFYEIPVHVFSDSNGDGIGDFAGVTSKLDYLEWLGVDCIWLLPFYPSPMVDGGYDVSDLTGVREEFGSIDDLRTLIVEAHRHGVAVIADLVINHTSDQHPWFQDARKPGSPNRDWYVWTDDPEKYSEARIIFVDTQDSNWTWDEVAGAYYWHRFYPEQPDLNFGNPEVRESVKDVIRFWLDMGFDGLRMDAIPYLFERDGTSSENLPETHAYLKEIRAMMDAEYSNRMIIAEANQPPADVVDYFGNDDECHMAYHFPVMPALYMALKRESIADIMKVLRATPATRPGSQWGVFLRNHDELTLEMVSQADREFMFQQYAPDPAMKKNIGIRRRLMPLLSNNRALYELLNGVLLSLPGSPFIYYGDEIGMGDNIELNDRDGLRTPMQWESGPQAGFSDADPKRFYHPVIADPEFSAAQVNVADQRGDVGSLLNWIRSMLAARRRHPVFGTGSLELLDLDPAVLAYIRRSGEEAVVVVANFSSKVRSVELPAPFRNGIDLLTGRQLQLADGLRLTAHQFLWLEAASP